MLFTWPYACIPLAFYIDGNLRARWHLEDVSRPASGYRFKGANMQMVFTSKVRRGGKLPQQEQRHQQHAPGRSRWLDCTNLWPLAVVGPSVFVFAAEWSSGALSVLLVCTPFVFLTLFSLTLNQVCVCACVVDPRPARRAFTAVLHMHCGSHLSHALEAFVCDSSRILRCRVQNRKASDWDRPTSWRYAADLSLPCSMLPA